MLKRVTYLTRELTSTQQGNGETECLRKGPCARWLAKQLEPNQRQTVIYQHA